MFQQVDQHSSNWENAAFKQHDRTCADILTLALRHLNDDDMPSLLLVELDSTDLDPLKLQASTEAGGGWHGYAALPSVVTAGRASSSSAVGNLNQV